MPCRNASCVIDSATIRTYDLYCPGVQKRLPVGSQTRGGRLRSGLAGLLCGHEVPAVAAPHPRGYSEPVSGTDCALAVSRATAARRRRIHEDPAYAGFTKAAITERIVGFTGQPIPGQDGWWRVGWIVDDIAEAELDVWFQPSARRIGVSERERPSVANPAPSEDPIIFDGERKRWIFRETREPVPTDLLERICRS